MTKHEFPSEFSAALHKNKAAAAVEILSEYEQHFAFKLADGYSEEEITVKSGTPEELAAQFQEGAAAPKPIGKNVFSGFGLALFGQGVLFAALFSYFSAFLGQVFHSPVHFHHNRLAGANGSAPLPGLPVFLQMKPRANRCIRFFCWNRELLVYLGMG